MSGHGHGHDHVYGHDHPSLAGWGAASPWATAFRRRPAAALRLPRDYGVLASLAPYNDIMID